MGNWYTIVYVLLAILLIVLFYYLLSKTEREIILYNSSYYVIDGDTVRVDGILYRDLIIDAPEMKNQKDRWVQNFNLNKTCMDNYGKIAKTFVELNIQSIRTDGRKDKYGRILGLFISNNTYLGLIMVERGLAFCYYRAPNDIQNSIIERCLILEQKARSERVGIWSCQLS